MQLVKSRKLKINMMLLVEIITESKNPDSMLFVPSSYENQNANQNVNEMGNKILRFNFKKVVTEFVQNS